MLKRVPTHCIFASVLFCVSHVGIVQTYASAQTDRLEQKTNPVSNENYVRWDLPANKQNAKRTPLSAASFFKRDTAVIYGRITGYDPQSGIRDVHLNLTNHLNGSSQKQAVEIKSDGSFVLNVPLNHPSLNDLWVGESVVELYMEPGQPLGIQFDMGDVKTGERIKQAQFSGPMASVNKGLQSAPKMGYGGFMKQWNAARELTPNVFADRQKAALNHFLDSLSNVPLTGDITSEVLEIRASEAVVANAVELFEYLSVRKRNFDSTRQVMKEPVDTSFYSFLKSMHLNDPKLLIPFNFTRFISDFNMFSIALSLPEKPISVVVNDADISIAVYDASSFKPSMTFSQYMLNKSGVKLSKEDEKLLRTWDSTDALADSAAEEKRSQTYEALMKKYKNAYDDYQSRIQKPESRVYNWDMVRSSLEHSLGIKPNLMSDILTIRSLTNNLFPMSKTTASILYPLLEKRVQHPFLKEESKLEYETRYTEGFSKEAFELPSGDAADLFLKLVEPFKGKFVLVDFWGASCGPCVSSIKRMDSTFLKYVNHPDMEFVYITSKEATSKVQYKAFNTNYLMKHSHLISDSDFRMLQSLLKFSGIPHYVLLDRTGRVLKQLSTLYFFDFEDFIRNNKAHE